MALVGLAGSTGAACGSSQTQAPSEPKGNFPVAARATFPTRQRLAEHTTLVVAVKNTGPKALPDVGVTITDGTPGQPNMGTQVQAFSYRLKMSNVANHSRPVWIIDKPPGPCRYSCQNGGPGGAATAFSNTWTLGELRPGKTASFAWHLTAVQPGAFVVNWRVAAGLFGNAKAVTANGGPPSGSFTVRISRKPPQAYVSNSGKIVTTP
ncbi:MAG: hypothetical protein JO321_02740 [Solirubrobacterales bacterium]|nr:hypothetical protein [Solirubrobacterales bacterium]